MPGKPFTLKKTDPVVEQFLAGVEAWERPHGEPGGGAGEETPAAARRAKAGRARGSVVTRKGVGAAAELVEALPEDDAVARRFREGVARWESPAGGGGDHG